MVLPAQECNGALSFVGVLTILQGVPLLGLPARLCLNAAAKHFFDGTVLLADIQVCQTVVLV